MKWLYHDIVSITGIGLELCYSQSVLSVISFLMLMVKERMQKDIADLQTKGLLVDIL